MPRLSNFFVAQRYYARMSWLFYGLLLVVVCVQLVLLLVLTATLTYLTTGRVGVLLMMWAMVVLVLYLLTGALIAQQTVKYGGISIAKQAKAVRLFVYPSAEQTVFSPSFIRVASPKELPHSYQRYYEFAEQLAIASGVPLPKLYVLPFEQGVNGFVAGFDVSDTVMVLTQGALDKLSNAELYGLLGHEFGHMIHGDARLNLKIYVMLTMLGWIYDFVDVLQEWIFGKFDKNYHQQPQSLQIGARALQVPLGQDKQAWVRYLQQNRHDIIQASKFGDIKSGVQDNQVYALMAYVLVALPLVVLRLFGVIGMASAEWIKQQFNHQREFLADATSVQLTRSADVVAALQSLKRHHTALHNPIFGTSMGHFFFASPKNGGYLHSHPDINKRLDVLYARDYQTFGEQMTADIDDQKLARAHQFVQDYQLALGDEPDEMASDEPEWVFEFWAEPEVVVDGRLLTQAWQTPAETPIICPSHTKAHPDIEPSFDPQMGHVSADVIKNSGLPWQITKALGKLPSTVALVEAILLCRYQRVVWLHTPYALPTIYHLPIADSPAPVHKLPSELLETVAKFDRRLNGVLLAIGLQHLCALQRQSSSAFVQDYQASLRWLLSASVDGATIRQYNNLSFDEQLTRDGNCPVHFDRVYQGAVMATLWRLFVAAPMPAYRQQLLACLLGADGAHADALLWLLLIFLLSAQDNGIYLCRYDKPIGTFRRWCQALNLVSDIDDDTIIKLMYQVRVLSVADWWVLMGAMNDTHRSVLDGVATAMVYDGVLMQHEYDLLAVLAVLWQKPMPII